MAVNEFNPGPIQDDNDFQDLYDAEETLSFCDLPRYNDAEWEDLAEEKDKGPSASADQEDFFEFFSEDFTGSTCPAEKSIIFCGKPIPCKEPLSENNSDKYLKKRSLLFRWKLSFNKSRTSRSDHSKKGRCMYDDYRGLKYTALPVSKNTNKNGGSERFDVSFRKVSMAKSRWQIFFFSVLRPLPTQMELSHIRNRQNQRTPSSRMFRSLDNSGDEEVSVGRSRGKGFWKMLMALGCRSHQANAVV